MWIASAMEHVGRATPACGTRRTASTTTCSACPTAGPAAQGSLDGRLAPALRGDGVRGRAAGRESRTARAVHWFLRAAPNWRRVMHDPTKPGVAGRRLLSILDEDRLRRVLARMLDENEFLSPLRHPLAVALSRRASLRHPGRRPGISRRLPAGRVRHRHVRRQFELARAGLDAGQLLSSFAPCCSTTCIYGDEFRVECPTGSGRYMNLYQVAEELARAAGRTSSCSDANGRRPCLWRAPEVPRRSALARLPALLRVLPRRQRRRHRGQPSDRLDRHYWPVDSPVCRPAACCAADRRQAAVF